MSGRQTRAEREQVLIDVALSDAEFRALAITVGALKPFSKPMQVAILHLVKTKLEEQEQS